MSVKAFVAGLAITAAMLASAVPGGLLAAEYKAEYKLSTVIGKPNPWGVGGERWAELVREKTGGRINIKMYPGSSLVNGDQTKEFTALRQGVIDLAVGSTINWSPQVRELNLFSLPFLMPDHKAIDALTEGEVGRRLFELLATKDVMPLAWGENGFREISNSRHPIRKPADMKGLKLRVVGSPLFLDTFTALGANPTQMSWADAQPALSTGAVDGQENPLSLFVGSRLHTLNQKYLTLWGYVADPLIFVVNRQVWESWTPEDQEAVRSAAITAAAEEKALARKGITAEDDEHLRTAAANGVDVVKLTADEQKAFQQATRAVYDKWAKQIGPDLVKAAEDAIAARN